MRAHYFYFAFILICLAGMVAPGCGGGESSSDKSSQTQVAPPGPKERFILPNIYNKKYRWSEFVGKPFLINIWATWCGPCRAEIPAMKNVYLEFQPKGLEIIAISMDEERTKAKVIPFMDEYRIPWVVVYGDQSVVSEFELGSNIPTTIFFDAAGNEVNRLVGAQTEETFRGEVARLFPPDAKK